MQQQAVAIAGGPQRPGDLQQRTGLSSGGVTKVVDRLEKKGLVSRDYGGVVGDRRGVLVSLTDLGRQRIRAMTEALGAHLPQSAGLVRELDRLLQG
ncbi:MAG: MarR family transcriptional regulator [Acidimicrobiia bacterium]|nr:MarR family transcriptional regulator [Acidimicrobiia bacterium]